MNVKGKFFHLEWINFCEILAIFAKFSPCEILEPLDSQMLSFTRNIFEFWGKISQKLKKSTVFSFLLLPLCSISLVNNILLQYPDFAKPIVRSEYRIARRKNSTF